jgi:serine/threonine protein kinase
MGNVAISIKLCCEKLCNLDYNKQNKKHNDLNEHLNKSNSPSSKFINNTLNNSTSFYNISQSRSKRNSQDKLSLYDFKLIKTLGKGSFGKVLLVNNLHNKKYYAMKILKKEFLKKQNQEGHTKTEREILEKINHPFIVKLHYAFQTNDKLYLVCDFMQGGEIFYHLRKEGCFTEERTKFYICEIILALEHLHKCGIIYRDLKPENILLDREGNIKLTDFGLSKILKTESFISNKNDNYLNNCDRAFTLCGTPEYLAPEILSGKGYNKSVDWWSLGTVMYEMLVGYSPYKDNKYKLDINTYKKPLVHHRNISKVAFSLIKELLNNDPSKRLGSGVNGVDEIKQHVFFKGVNWISFINKTVSPKFIPYIKNEEDLSNFDCMFTDENPNSINDKSNLFPNEGKDTNNYENFTFNSSDNILLKENI